MPSKIQEMLRLQRQNAETARAGLAWDADEENRLISQVLDGVSLLDIAKELQRTEGSIRTRLLTIVCSKIDNGEETVDSAYEKFNVSESELNEFRDKKHKREERLQQRQQNREQNKKARKANAKTPAPNGYNNYSVDDVMKYLVEIRNDINLLKYHFKIH